MNATETTARDLVQATEAEIRQGPGALMLIIQRSETSRQGAGGCFAPDADYDERIGLTLAVLQTDVDGFCLNSKTGELPTEHWYGDGPVNGHRYYPGEPSVQEGAWGVKYLLPIAELLVSPIELHNCWAKNGTGRGYRWWLATQQ